MMKTPFHVTLRPLFARWMLILLALHQGEFLPGQTDRIYGGTQVDIQDYPWQVSIESTSTAAHFCGGTILNEYWILTAAHCLPQQPSSLTIHAGSTDQTDNGTGQRIVAAQFFSADWNMATMEHDIALIRLSAPLCFNEYVQPIQYATSLNVTLDDYNVNSPGWLSGWGDTEDPGGNVAHLRAVQIPIISIANANQLMNEKGCMELATMNMIPFYETGKSTGGGDSGGPAIIRKSDGTPIVIGVTSWGCDPKPDYPSIYTRVLSYTDLMEDNEVYYNNSCSLYCEMDRQIEEDETYEKDMTINGDIVVHTGNVLTIRSTLRFTEGHGIIVRRGAKLIVDGGTLTKCEEATDWRGIHVEGNPTEAHPFSPNNLPTNIDPGMVVVINESNIFFAQNAISTTRYGESWNSAYWGGYVYCESATFENCNRAAEFMKYDLENKSRFIDCTIKNGRYGVTIWDTDHIQMEHCTLQNLSVVAITTWDAGAKIFNGCLLADNTVGIQSNATSPLSSGSLLEIGDEDYATNVLKNNTSYSIELRSSALYKTTLIEDNSFLGSPVSIWIDGQNSATVRQNYFGDTDFGILTEYTDEGINSFSCNSFTNNVVLPITYIGKNDNSRFTQNTFENDFCDVFISGSEGSPGSIHPHQGGFGSPAKNCFSVSNTEHIWTWGQTLPFRYYVSMAPVACHVPQAGSQGTNNYQVVSTSDFGTINCNLLTGGGGLGDIAFPEDDPDDHFKGRDARTEDLLDEPVDDKPLRSNENDGVLSLQSQYSFFLDQGKLDQAKDILDKLTPKSQSQIWFKDIQKIKLRFLEAPGSFSLLPQEKDLLTTLATGTSSQRGMARSLLSLLESTQFVHDFRLPAVLHGSRSSVATALDTQPRLKPNPAYDFIELEFPGMTDKGIVHLYNLNGQMVQSAQHDGSGHLYIRVNDLEPGVYFMECIGEASKVHRLKILIQR